MLNKLVYKWEMRKYNRFVCSVFVLFGVYIAAAAYMLTTLYNPRRNSVYARPRLALTLYHLDAHTVEFYVL